MNGKALGHYRVGEKLGRGGMGEVYVADGQTLRQVAIMAPVRDNRRLHSFERAPDSCGVLELRESFGSHKR